MSLVCVRGVLFVFAMSGIEVGVDKVYHLSASINLWSHFPFAMVLCKLRLHRSVL